MRFGLFFRHLHLLHPPVHPFSPHTLWFCSFFSCLSCLHVSSSHPVFSFAHTLAQPLANSRTIASKRGFILGRPGRYKEVCLVQCLPLVTSSSFRPLRAHTYTLVWALGSGSRFCTLYGGRAGENLESKRTIANLSVISRSRGAQHL